MGVVGRWTWLEARKNFLSQSCPKMEQPDSEGSVSPAWIKSRRGPFRGALPLLWPPCAEIKDDHPFLSTYCVPGIALPFVWTDPLHQIAHCKDRETKARRGLLTCPSYGSRLLSHFSRVRLFVTLWTVAHQSPLSMEFSRQEYWSG